MVGGAGFNPLPARRPGATIIAGGVSISVVWFQSSPSAKAGSYRNLVTSLRHKAVSILSQPEGRELPIARCLGPKCYKFQSSPSPKAGSYASLVSAGSCILAFQSSPSPKAGSYWLLTSPSSVGNCVSILSQPEGRELRRIRCSLACRTRFNPLPARRPGATQKLRLLARWAIVSILSQPEGRELLMAR